MNRQLVILLACSWLLQLSAQPGQFEPSRRYLFVIDTSFSMSSLSATTRNTVYDLIENGMNGRIRAGDTIEFWTFNEEVHTHLIPLQVWVPELNHALALRTTRFLQNQHFEKQTRLDKALTDLHKAIKAVDSLTVFLVTDGTELVRGTPFDSSINAIFQKDSKSLRHAKRPLVVAFVSQRGKFIDWAVSPGGGEILIPEIPAPARIAHIELSSKAVQSPAKPQTAAPPPATPVATEKPALKLISDPPPPIKEPLVKPEVQPSTTVATPPKNAEPKVPVPTSNPSVTSAAVNPKPQSVPESIRTEPLKKETVTPVPVTPTATENKSAAPTAPPLQKPEPAAATTSSVKSDTAPPNNVTSLPNEKVPQLPPQKTEPTVVPSQTTRVESAPPNNQKVETFKTANQPTPQKVVPPHETNVVAESPRSQPAALKVSQKQTAVVLPSEPAAGSSSFLIIGLGLLSAAFGLGYFYLRSHRSPRQASFISRSIDREEK